VAEAIPASPVGSEISKRASGAASEAAAPHPWVAAGALGAVGDTAVTCTVSSASAPRLSHQYKIANTTMAETKTFIKMKGSMRRTDIILSQG
jgi:hypothetical protein